MLVNPPCLLICGWLSVVPLLSPSQSLRDFLESPILPPFQRVPSVVRLCFASTLGSPCLVVSNHSLGLCFVVFGALSVASRWVCFRKERSSKRMFSFSCRKTRVDSLHRQPFATCLLPLPQSCWAHSFGTMLSLITV